MELKNVFLCRFSWLPLVWFQQVCGLLLSFFPYLKNVMFSFVGTEILKIKVYFLCVILNKRIMKKWNLFYIVWLTWINISIFFQLKFKFSSSKILVIIWMTLCISHFMTNVVQGSTFYEHVWCTRLFILIIRPTLIFNTFHFKYFIYKIFFYEYLNFTDQSCQV